MVVNSVMAPTAGHLLLHDHFANFVVREIYLSRIGIKRIANDSTHVTCFVGLAVCCASGVPAFCSTLSKECKCIDFFFPVDVSGQAAEVAFNN
jgi:hypothetical protein